MSKLTHQLVEWALAEDLMPAGDVTATALASLLPAQATASIVTRTAGVIAGLDLAEQAFQHLDAGVAFKTLVHNGDAVAASTTLATVSGRADSLLKAERVALNLLQHLSGIATRTRQFVEAVEGTGCRIAHTRKTTPGLRLAEQQAVVMGGGARHRFNLSSAAMLKDNHQRAIDAKDSRQAIAVGCRLLRESLPHTATITVEVESLAEVQAALDAGADVILLDNMAVALTREAVSLINGRAVVEASGGITLETVRAVAETGVNVISTSQITLGAPVLDIGLDWTS